MKWIILFFLAISLSACSNNSSPVKTGLEGKRLPSFELLLMDSLTRLNTEDIPPGRPIVLFLFSPDCPYCRAQTDEIIEDISLLKNVRFYFLSPLPFSRVKDYANHYRLDKYANITVGQDDSSYVARYFNADAVPYIAIYDRDKRLKEVFVGKIDTDVIRKIDF